MHLYCPPRCYFRVVAAVSPLREGRTRFRDRYCSCAFPTEVFNSFLPSGSKIPFIVIHQLYIPADPLPGRTPYSYGKHSEFHQRQNNVVYRLLHPRLSTMLQYFPLDLTYNIVDELQSSKDARSLSQTSKQLQSTLEPILDHQSRTHWESLKLPWPLLHRAVHTKSRRLALRVLEADPDCVNTVIPDDPETPEQPIGTALHSAVSKLDYGMVVLLCDNGANVHIREHDGNTALLVALSWTTRSASDDEKVQYEIVRMLLKYFNILHVLTEGLRVAPTTAPPLTAEVGPADVQKSSSGSNPHVHNNPVLHLAAGLPSSIAGLDMIRDLLSPGCPINKRNSENPTALFFAHNTSMACYLISKGASGWVVDCTGGTVLHYVTNNLTKDKHHITNALLNQTSVNMDAKDKDGMTAYEYASAGYGQDTMNVFSEYERDW